MPTTHVMCFSPREGPALCWSHGTCRTPYHTACEEDLLLPSPGGQLTSRRHKAEPWPSTGPWARPASYPPSSTSGGPGQRQEKEALGSSVQDPLAVVRLVGKSVGERGRILCS